MTPTSTPARRAVRPSPRTPRSARTAAWSGALARWLRGATAPTTDALPDSAAGVRGATMVGMRFYVCIAALALAALAAAEDKAAAGVPVARFAYLSDTVESAGMSGSWRDASEGARFATRDRVRTGQTGLVR